MLYEVAIAAEVFGVDRSDLSPTGSWYRMTAHTGDGSPHPFLPAAASAPFSALTEVDTIIVPSTDDPQAEPSPSLVEALRAAHGHGIRVVSLCTGSFVLAAAGILDGRSATTHWMHTDELAHRYPNITVRSDVLYTDDGQVLTSAGKTAALDLCLHLVHTDFGAGAANGVARRLVTPAHRPGGQAQFITPPTDPRNPVGLGPALDWARANLDGRLTVADLASRAGLSSRQLARRMHAELQTGPLAWIHRERIHRAQELLERTDASVDAIALRCGMGTAATLRRHFRRAIGVSPTVYRAAFRRPDTGILRFPPKAHRGTVVG